MSEESFSDAEFEALDAEGQRRTIKWNEPHHEVLRRTSVLSDSETLGLAGLRLQAEAILARTCGPEEVDALVEIGPRVGPILVKMARKRDDCLPYCQMRAGAIAALGHLRFADAVDPLGTLVSDRRENVAIRAQAALAIGRIGSDVVVNLLGRVLLTDRDAAVRRSAAKGLGESGNLVGVAALERAMAEDEDVGVRRQAGASMSALEKLHNAKLTDVGTPPPPRRRQPKRDRDAEQRYAARLRAKRR
jgi:hypothetical protein